VKSSFAGNTKATKLYWPALRPEQRVMTYPLFAIVSSDTSRPTLLRL